MPPETSWGDTLPRWIQNAGHDPRPPRGPRGHGGGLRGAVEEGVHHRRLRAQVLGAVLTTGGQILKYGS